MPITKRTDKASRGYWAIAKEAKKEVDKWPKWKREVRLMELFKGNNRSGSADDATKPKT